MGLGRREARHDTALSRVHAMGEDQYDHAPGDEVMTPDGPGKVEARSDGGFRGDENYEVTLHGGMGGGTYSSGQLTSRSSTTAAGIHLASDDYPELAQVLQERPDIALPVRMSSVAPHQPELPEDPQPEPPDEEAEHYDPACAYGHEGPCPNWSHQSFTHHAVHHTAMPPKSGRQPKGDYDYEMQHEGLKGKLDGEDAGYIRHTAYDENNHDVTGDKDASETARAVKVHMLHTSPSARGTGVASAMMDSLYHHYPNAWINHGYRTDDGSTWWNSYDEPDPHRNVHNVAPGETGKRLDHPWTNHFDTDDVVSDMSSLSDTNEDLGHEGNAHRQFDHTQYGGTNGARCENCDSDREHHCNKCDNYYPHQHEGDDHRDYEDCPSQCDDCDSDGEHECHECGDWVKHDGLDDHQNEHDEDAAKEEQNSDPKHDPTQVGLHNTVTLNLSREQHNFLHDHSIPADKRAHHIMNMVGRSQMPTDDWVNDSQNSRDEEHESQPGNQQGHGRGAHTMVTLHAHPLNDKESGAMYGEEHYTRNGDRTSLDNSPTNFRLKGISWGDGSSPEHRHDFSGGGHTVSTPPSGQQQELRFQPREVRPLNRQQPHGPAPVDVHPDQQKLFARKTAGSFNGMDGGFEDVSDHVPEEEIVTHGSFDPYSLLTVAAADPEFKFHFTAAWADVRKKAKRIRAEGGVNITLASDGVVFGNVKGDHNTYETGVQRLPGARNSIATYSCGCKWGAYHWGATDDFSRFAGRMCSHALALQFEAQSRGMFGRDVVPDARKPEWVPKHVVIRYDIDSGENRMVRSASKVDTALDFLITLARAQGDDPEELAFLLSSMGMPVTAAVNSPWGEPQPERPAYTQGPTKPKNTSENPGSTGWAVQGDPQNWDQVTPNSLGDRIGSLTDEFLFEAAIPQEVAQSDDPLGSQEGVEGLPQDLPMVMGAASEDGPDRPSGPKGGDGGRMPPGHPGMPQHDAEEGLDKEAFWQVLLRAAPAIISGVSQMARNKGDGAEEEQDNRSEEEKRLNAEGLTSSLHMEPEGALPFTDGDGPDLTDDESLTPPHTASQGVSDVVAQFQATASHLAPGGGSTVPLSGAGDASEIAAAARAVLAKVAVKDYTPVEQAAIINEGVHVRASNLDRLDIADTHYAHMTDEDDDGWL